MERPFLKALVLRKVRKSKNKEQTRELIVAYDKSKYKKNAQYLYDRAKDPEAVKEQLKSKAAALRAADEAKTADAAAAAVAPLYTTFGSNTGALRVACRFWGDLWKPAGR